MQREACQCEPEAAAAEEAGGDNAARQPEEEAYGEAARAVVAIAVATRGGAAEAVQESNAGDGCKWASCSDSASNQLLPISSHIIGVLTSNVCF